MNNLLEKDVEREGKLINELYTEISSIILKNKEKMTYQINDTLVNTYFLIGKIIVENEQNGNIRAIYGKELLKKLSKKLTEKFGSGFSISGLYNMRLFYSKYKNFQPLARNLSWSHYCYLIYIEDDDERAFYEKECINSKCSKRKMEYALGGLSNNVFASTYTFYIPNKEQLINEIEKALKENDNFESKSN